MINPPVRKHTSPRPTRGLWTLFAWFALICGGGVSSAALALGSPLPAWLPSWLPVWSLLLLAGLGAAAGMSAAAAALDRGWLVLSLFLATVALAASLPALLAGGCVGRGHGFAFALPSWIGMGIATLFLCRPDAWADGFELLAELPLLRSRMPEGVASWPRHS